MIMKKSILRNLLIISCTIAALLFAIFMGIKWRADQWEPRWVEFIELWEERGERFDIASALPELIPDEENFFAHPHVRNILSGSFKYPDPHESAELKGYLTWLSDSQAVMSPELAELLLRILEPFGDGIEDLVDAAKRDGARLEADTAVGILEQSVHLLRDAADAMGMRANARLALGKAHEAAADFEAMLSVAGHLRATRTLMGMVIASHFEGLVFDGVVRESDWSVEARLRLLDALQRKAVGLDEEYARMLRLERNVVLEFHDQEAEWPGWFPDSRNARFKLETCESLQAMVLSDRGEIVDRVDGRRLMNYVEYYRKHIGNSRENHATNFALLYASLYESMEMVEQQRAEVIQSL